MIFLLKCIYFIMNLLKRLCICRNLAFFIYLYLVFLSFSHLCVSPYLAFFTNFPLIDYVESYTISRSLWNTIERCKEYAIKLKISMSILWKIIFYILVSFFYIFIFYFSVDFSLSLRSISYKDFFKLFFIYSDFFISSFPVYPIHLTLFFFKFYLYFFFIYFCF